MRNPRKIAQEMLDLIEWSDSVKGFCKCPGEHLHSTSTGAKDCAVFLDKVPTIHCFHQSCREVIAECNRGLRRAIARGNPAGVVYTKSDESAARNENKKQQRQLATRAEASLPGILKQYPWPVDSIKHDSPCDLTRMPPNEGSRRIISLFEPGDTIWVGEKYCSGAKFKRSFRLRDEWQRCAIRHSHFICPSTFKPGSFERKNANVWDRRFLVVESDTLGKDEVGAVFKWLRDAVGMNLKAVVDTAGKSLHGWFTFPPPEVFKELQIILPELECDPGMFTASQPCRLPGVLRDGKMQTLIHFNP